jgi:hypothetical protein
MTRIKTLFVPVFIFFIFTTSSGQVKEEVSMMSQGLYNSFSIVLQGADKKLADNLWKDYIRKYGGKYKWDRKNNEHQLTNAIIGNISVSKPINIFATTKVVGHDIVLTSWFQIEEKFIQSDKDPEYYEAIELQLQHFARELSREKLRLLIVDEEKTLAKIESEMSKLTKRKENLENEIEKAKKRIQDAEQEIILNLEEQNKTQLNSKSQQETINQLKQKLHDM